MIALTLSQAFAADFLVLPDYSISPPVILVVRVSKNFDDIEMKVDNFTMSNDIIM